jgi:hypothetical protein
LSIAPNPRAADDQQDAARILAGDTRAFEGIVRRWQSPLINLAYRFCRDRGRAEEMAQEAFLRAYRNLASWRQESAFSTWLFALATNLYCTELRRLPPNTLPFDETATLKIFAKGIGRLCGTNDHMRSNRLWPPICGDFSPSEPRVVYRRHPIPAACDECHCALCWGQRIYLCVRYICSPECR